MLNSTYTANIPADLDIFRGIPKYNRFIYFYKEGPFNQWSRTEPFVVGNKTYNCAEQWMMESKAKYFNDPESAEKIMVETHPRAQQSRGREVKNYIDSHWNAVARDFVLYGNLEKFAQNPKALEILMKTEGCLLVEASPIDHKWGIGISDEQAAAGKAWRGSNWLGECVTKVREIFEQKLSLDEVKANLLQKIVEAKNGQR